MVYKRSVIILLSFTAVFVLISSCEFTDTSSATVPAYISIPSFSYITDTTTGFGYQGNNSQKFTDLWVTSSGNTIGTVGLPVLLPIQKTGSHLISVDPGIIQSGQDDHRIAYPFIESYTQTINLIPGKIDTIYPVFKYLPNVKFADIYDFDYIQSSGGITLNPNYVVKGDTFYKVKGTGSRTLNNYYLECDIAPTSLTYQILTRLMPLPGLGTPVYLEMDYQSDVMIQVGYYYIEPGQPGSIATSVINLYPSSGWNKLYLNLSDEVSARKAGTQFQFYFGMFNNSGIKPHISLDNIKILTLD
jgi:hypothetical protein